MNKSLAVFAILFFSAPAWAVLGRSAQSVELDRQTFNGRLTTVAHDSYSVHRIAAADGTVIREYVSRSGVVFGLAWDSPRVPNMAQLLGSYFEQFQQAAQTTAHHRGPLAIRTNQLVVEIGGHMRSFHGRAYLVGAAPTDLLEAVVQ